MNSFLAYSFHSLLLVYLFIHLFTYSVAFFISESEAVAQRCSIKKVFLKFSQNSQEKNLRRSLFLNKIAGLRLLILLKKRLWHKCFPVNFVKYLRIPIFIEHLWWLLLQNNKHYLDRFIPMNSRELLIKQWGVKSSDSSLTLSWRIGWRL